MREPTSWRSLLTCRRHCPSCFLFTSRRPLSLASPPLRPPLSLIPLFSGWMLFTHPSLQVVATTLLLGGHQDV